MVANELMSDFGAGMSSLREVKTGVGKITGFVSGLAGLGAGFNNV